MPKATEHEPSTLSKIGRLLDAWSGLGEVERTTLLTIAMRLSAGQRLHGKLTYEKKPWKVEELEEHLDSSVYAAVRLGQHIEEAFNRCVTETEAEVLALKVPQQEEVYSGPTWFNNPLGMPDKV